MITIGIITEALTANCTDLLQRSGCRVWYHSPDFPRVSSACEVLRACFGVEFPGGEDGNPNAIICPGREPLLAMMRGIRSGHSLQECRFGVAALRKVFVCILLLGALPLWGQVTGTEPSYTLIASPAAVTVNAGSSGNVALKLTSVDYAGSVSFLVTSSQPLLVNGQTPPLPVVLTSGGTGASALIIDATASASNHVPPHPWPHAWTSGGVVIFCGLMVYAPFGLGRKQVAALLLTALTILVAGFLVSCGGGVKTPPRIYTLTVTPTGTGTVTNPAPVSIQVTVP